jgi:hypothetical protein
MWKCFVCLFVLLAFFDSACASTKQQGKAVLTNQFATVYFYRTHSSPGGAVPVDIEDNDIDVGTLPDGCFFVYHATPGVHTFTLTTDSTAQERLNLQAGDIYYVKAGVGDDPFRLRPSLEVMFELQGETDVQYLKQLRYHE